MSKLLLLIVLLLSSSTLLVVHSQTATATLSCQSCLDQGCVFCEALFDQSNAPTRCECGTAPTCNSTSHIEYSNEDGEGIPCFEFNNYTSSVLAAGTGVFIAVFVGSLVCCCCAVGLFAWCCMYIMKPRRNIQEHPPVYATGAAIPPSTHMMMPPIKETEQDALDTTTTTTTVYNEENPPAFAPTTANDDNNLPVAEAVVYDVDGSKV